MSSLIKTLRNIKKIGLYAYGHQMQTIGDAKYGRLVGTDSLGNKYFENLDETPNRTRWVDYKNPLYDASEVEPGWHAWLKHMVDVAPSEVNSSAPSWKKPFQPNLTLSSGAYKPYSTTPPKFTSWTPRIKQRSS